jgi:DoxX-like family
MRAVDAMRYGVSGVWILLGLYFKVLGRVPRHREIVARVVSDKLAPTLTVLIGLGEIGIGLWMASGLHTLECVLLQTLLIVMMNAIELRIARDLLLFPVKMVLMNLTLLATGFWVALH